MPNDDFTQNLQSLMQRVGISSFKSLSRAAGVSERQIVQLRRGKLEQMRVGVLLKLSKILQLSLSELAATFSDVSSTVNNQYADTDTKLLQEIADLKGEYQRLVLKLEQQRELLQQEFQESSLQMLESLLLFWPTAAQKAKDNPQLEAIKMLPLVQKPLDRLLQAWGVEAIATVGAEIPYNPQLHQLLEGTAEHGEIVKVCYIGYRHAGKLLNRAKVIRL
ncbi:nucleotide exchange factor GrpE [Anabaena cylindrica FACHB-243]|uniref:XRE family transcriptional regulator n=1 Tax=Anabaena cylindrica (strain ATCC 27899 / PCC 7122) TaxID=272123 RepID=K9ZCA4_ANACC|nr:MULTISPECIES: nucleotide exchange factor GrpE [Anabaena]AFZ56212.1 XRE family transcriptional regulator [Anabaena cylindrica PCC 7122]MBD2417440.1 nucleotide exchange factor GrpE [Anabaena cylindrica FACHB-243]MBY5284625.1 nucleotide exchange factor GrpE [Anabaena sp. CCAP 1446/1C]MBY5311464.1 nucleotide exchange factor GrpE [Anabaena sp. CCAP 1446/1C]MCM2407609.1 nucleotide exchange factor GrpE [Anabaena sp. CCAP 1446/1C]